MCLANASVLCSTIFNIMFNRGEGFHPLGLIHCVGMIHCVSLSVEIN